MKYLWLNKVACVNCSATDVLEETGRVRYSCPLQVEVRCLSCKHVFYVEDPDSGIKVVDKVPERVRLTSDQVWELNQGKSNHELVCPGCLRVGAHQGSRQDAGAVTCDHCGCEYRVRPREK